MGARGIAAAEALEVERGRRGGMVDAKHEGCGGGWKAKGVVSRVQAPAAHARVGARRDNGR